MAKRARSKEYETSGASADALLEELVKFLARRAAERDDQASRSNAERTARPKGGKRDSG